MTDDIPSLAEAMAEIRRLRAELDAMVQEMQRVKLLPHLQKQIDDAIAFGTLERPAEAEPATITHDIPPNAPR